MNDSTTTSRKALSSPCIDVCRLDDSGRYCTGCYRTLEEISSWSRYSAGQRQAVLAALVRRRKRASSEVDPGQMP